MGGASSLAQKEDGSWWRWGQDGHPAHYIDIFTEQAIEFVSLSAGRDHTLGIDVNGIVHGWGSNSSTQLGGTLCGPGVDRFNNPTQIENGTWAIVDAAYDASVAISADGMRLFHWGDAANALRGGRISSRPAYASGGWSIVAASAGGRHILSLSSTGAVWATGDNAKGQLGIGSSGGAAALIQVGSDEDWVEVSAGRYHSIALKSDGTIWGWGSNFLGQLAAPSYDIYSAPLLIDSGYDWVSAAAGGDHTLAIRSEGTLWAWGHNNSGQLGDGTFENRPTPTQIGEDADWESIAAEADLSAGIKTDGTLWAWGDERRVPIFSSIPVRVVGLSLTVPKGPLFQITSYWGLTNKTEQTLAGMVAAGAQIDIYIDTNTLVSAVEYQTPTDWSCKLTNLEEGMNRLILIASDQKGNFSRIDMSIVVDLTPPSEIIENPEIYTKDPNQTISDSGGGGGGCFIYSLW